MARSGRYEGCRGQCQLARRVRPAASPAPRGRRLLVGGLLPLLSLLLPGLPRLAQGDQLLLPDGPGCLELKGELELLPDPEGRLDLQAVMGEAAGEFRPAASAVLHEKAREHPHWVRLTLVAPSSAAADATWHLEVPARFRSLEVYLPQPSGGGWQQRRYGFWDSDGLDRHVSVPLPRLAARQPTTILLHLQWAWFVQAPLRICSVDRTLALGQQRSLFYGISLGVLLLAALFNLFLALQLRERTSLWLALFELAAALSILSTTGLGDPLVRWLTPRQLGQLLTAIDAGIILAATSFTRDFLPLRSQMPRTDRLLKAYMLAGASLVVLQLLLPSRVAHLLFILLALLAPLALLVPGVICWRRGFARAPVYLAAWGAVVVVGTASVLPGLELELKVQLLLAGYGINALLLLLATVGRLRTLQRSSEELSRALAESELKHRTIFENAQVGLFRLRSSDGRMLEANSTMARLFGYDGRQEYLDTFSMKEAWVEPAEREELYQRLAANGGIVDKQEARFRRKDGSIGWYRFSARYFPERDYMEGVGLEITEERRAREEIQRSELRFRALAESTRAMIVIYDPAERRIRYANPAARETTGYTAEELAGRRPQELIHPDDLPLLEPMGQAMRQGGAGAVEPVLLRYRTRTGETRWVELAGAPIELEGGTAWLATAFDVTTRRAAEQQMMRADKMAALGMIIAGVAHEINNPNNFIYFNLPILRQYLDGLRPLVERGTADLPEATVLGMPCQELWADMERLLDDMEHGSARITSIVSELKHYVRGDEAAEERKPESVQAVVDHVMTLVGKQVRKMVRRFDVQVEPGLPPVKMNAGKIEQALINIVINAGQAADKDDSCIRLAARRKAGRPDRVELVVEDNGCGMPPDVLARIFDPFYTTKGRDAGTGLGLGIAERIVEEHGGRITVTSTPREGSCFTIELPGESG